MDKMMQEKIQSILDGIKDPVSCLPIVELDMIERVRYLENDRELKIFTSFPADGKACMNCVGISTVMIDGIRRNIFRDFEAAFPELTISIV